MIQQLRIQGIAPCALPPGEIAVDLFAGGGGASRGIELATGISPAIAINHDPHAIKMHEANHPDTIHFCQDVYHREVHPRDLVKGQRVGLLWLSPDCRHFSRAKGSAPVSASVRSLAMIGLRWAKYARPRMVFLENVAEFLTWCPLLPNGKPNLARKGEIFNAFVREWKRYGYDVAWKVIVCADHDAPTKRKRLFFVARNDHEPIIFAAPTRSRLGRPKPWRTAAECIDFSLACPSIFARKKPLATATCRRIARGIGRYVLNGQPFIVQVAHGDHTQRPGDRCTGMDAPLGTISKINSHALVAATLIHTGNGERDGQAPRCQDIRQPIGTVVAQRSNGALVAAFLAKHNGGATGQALDEPMHTVTGKDTKRVVVGSLIQIGARHGGGDQALDQPMATMLTTERFALVAAFLVQYYSEGKTSQPLTDPMDTVVTRARHGLVTLTIDGQDYAIIDIGMRMLTPRELARAQGFDDDYILTGTKAQQIARIGNSVCPPVAAAVIAANLTSPIRKQVA